MTELPAYIVHFLAEAMAWAKGSPEHAGAPSMYLGKIEVICEGEVIGHLINEDPDWLFRPVE